MLLRSSSPLRPLLPRLKRVGSQPVRTLFGLPGFTPKPQVHQERRILKYPPSLVYAVVAGVDDYKHFVPWCVDSHILSKKGNVMKAELSVGFRLFKERYVSTVIIDPGKRVQARAQETQLFQYLTNDWVLQPGPEPGTCWTNFRVEFCFRSVVYAQASALFFDEVVYKMVQAFEDRCGVVQERRRKEQLSEELSSGDESDLDLGVRIMEAANQETLSGDFRQEGLVAPSTPTPASSDVDHNSFVVLPEKAAATLKPEDAIVARPAIPSHSRSTPLPVHPIPKQQSQVPPRVSQPPRGRANEFSHNLNVSSHATKPAPRRKSREVRPLPSSLWF